MRRAFAIALAAAAWFALAGCSSTDETDKKAPAARRESVPEVYRVRLDTSKGPVVIEAHRAWAPAGADHFHSLVRMGYYDGNRFYRVVRDYIVQWGVSGDPEMNRMWATASLPDDPVKESNVRGAVSFAALGPNSRSTQLFINLKDNKSLDKQGFAPIGKVVSGMDVVDSFYKFYGDMAPRGQGPDPKLIATQGNDYLTTKFPRLDYIVKATLE